MITAVHDALQRQQFLRAAQAWDYFRAVLGMRLALYGEQPAAGWSFYTGARGVCAALAVRGATAFACGTWDYEELGAFLQFLGVQDVITPSGLQNGQSACEADFLPLVQYRLPMPGYNPRQALFLYTLAPGAPTTLPKAAVPQNATETPHFTVCQNPPMGAVTRLLWGEGPEADAFYAEACAARNRGWAEYCLAEMEGEAVCTVGAAAIFGGEAYMAAGQTAEAWRGQGIGGQLIAALANDLSTRGLRVTLLCEAALCGFYQRLGFSAGGRYIKWHAAHE